MEEIPNWRDAAVDITINLLKMKCKTRTRWFLLCDSFSRYCISSACLLSGIEINIGSQTCATVCCVFGFFTVRSKCLKPKHTATAFQLSHKNWLTHLQCQKLELSVASHFAMIPLADISNHIRSNLAQLSANHQTFTSRMVITWESRICIEKKKHQESDNDFLSSRKNGKRSAWC